MPGFYSMTCHQGFGEKTAALPSGRLSGKPLADGLAPVDGTDVLGPTASLNSVAKLEQQRFGNGINLNIKFDAGTVAGAEGRAARILAHRGLIAPHPRFDITSIPGHEANSLLLFPTLAACHPTTWVGMLKSSLNDLRAEANAMRHDVGTSLDGD